MSVTLNYTSPASDAKVLARQRFFWRAAIVCGLVPLLAGTAVFLLWLLTDWMPLMLAGYVTILGGTAIVLAGLVFLGMYAIQAPRLLPPAPRFGLSTLAVAALLLVNFPLAALYTWGAIYKFTLYTVTVTNAGARTPDHVIITARGVHGGK